MATAPRQRATREIEYPTGGKPMAETDVHRDDMVDVIDSLRYHFVDDPNVYISGNLLLYYEEGNPRKHVGPMFWSPSGFPRSRLASITRFGRKEDSECGHRDHLEVDQARGQQD